MTNEKINRTLYTDNTGVIKFAKRGVGQRTKHLDLRLKHLYDLYTKKIIDKDNGQRPLSLYRAHSLF